MYGKGYGMPSSHSQFVTFFSLSLSLFLIFRHIPAPYSTHTPYSFAERLLLSLVACVGAAVVASSRVYLNYHTPKQVLVGCTAGALFAVLWFLLTTLLRRYGWIDWGLDAPLGRLLRMRDLIITEDLADAGWERWDSKRRLRRGEANGTIKKTR